MVQQNRLSHALIFLSKEGSGALPLALAFAQYTVCEKVQNKNAAAGALLFGFDERAATETPKALNDSCGQCPACTKAAKFIHPDIHYAYPVISSGKSGEKPKAPTISPTGGNLSRNTLMATLTTGCSQSVPKTNKVTSPQMNATISTANSALRVLRVATKYCSCGCRNILAKKATSF